MKNSTTQKAPETLGPEYALFLANRKRRADAERRAGVLRRKIEETKDAEERAMLDVPSSEEVRQQSEDLAAAIALGQATAAEEKARREELEKSEARIGKAIANQRALRETRAGLERMLALTQAEIETLSDEGRALLEQALRDEAERIGSEYFECAKKTKAAFVRLAAINRLLPEVTGNHRVSRIAASDVAQMFCLPAFRLKIFDGKVRPNNYRLDNFSDSDSDYAYDISHYVQAEADERRLLLLNSGLGS